MAWVGPGETRKAGRAGIRLPDPGILPVRIYVALEPSEIQVEVIEDGKTRIPDTRIPLAGPEEPLPEEEVLLYALPDGKDLGVEVAKGTIRITVPAREGLQVPKDFGSAWFVILDDKGEVLLHGPLDGGTTDPRTYGEKELEALSAPVTRDFPLPNGARRIQVGIQAANGTTQGILLTSPTVDVP